MIRAPVCSCGGRLQRADVARVDLAVLFGLKGAIRGIVPGLRCDTCRGETFEAGAMERMLDVVARRVLSGPRLLAPEEARFLRKAVLGLTQEGLAKRMRINKITVADWERGERTLSKEHDYELRGIALSSLLDRAATRRVAGLRELTREAIAVLTAPRTARPLKRSARYLIDASHMNAA